MSQAKIKQLLDQLTSELIAHGVRMSEAMERARNIAQIAVLDGMVSAADIYGIITPSSIASGIADPADRAEVAELLAAIWTAEAGC